MDFFPFLSNTYIEKKFFSMKSFKHLMIVYYDYLSLVHKTLKGNITSF